jgi:ABC-2 type transport system ATP-binding protein
MSAATQSAQSAPLLEARGLTVRFGEVTALGGLDLIAPPGEVLAILGPNGAGKTTFVRTVATLLKPASGELRVRGSDVAGDPVSVRRDIGLAGQFAAVEPAMTGRENLEMTARLFGHRKKAARRAASAVIEQLSLEEVANRRCSTYSGGQRRRLDLGASLVGAPRRSQSAAQVRPDSRPERHGNRSVRAVPVQLPVRVRRRHPRRRLGLC